MHDINAIIATHGHGAIEKDHIPLTKLVMHRHASTHHPAFLTRGNLTPPNYCDGDGFMTFYVGQECFQHFGVIQFETGALYYG